MLFRSVDIGTRTRQEPSGSVDERLHAASHMMAYHLRVIKRERLDLLMKTMAVHSAVRRTGHQNDDLEESIKALLTDLRDQRERHVGLQISQHEVEIQTRMGTIWVHREGEIETQPRPKIQEIPKGNDLDIEMAIEGLTLRDPDPPKWTWSPLYGAIHQGNSCLDCNV